MYGGSSRIQCFTERGVSFSQERMGFFSSCMSDLITLRGTNGDAFPEKICRLIDKFQSIGRKFVHW